MKKLSALLCTSIAVLAGAVASGAGAAPSPAARTVGAADPTPVKAGVDAWSAGDYTTAIALWRPLADRGDPDALFNLAQAYKLGRGVPTDLVQAEDLYGKAAAKGHVQAADNYGLLMFQSGERTKALPFVQASAARGDARAMYILGVAYFNGDVVPKDWERAYALTSLARDAGLPQASRALTQMDQHIPLATRQKSVVLGQKLSAEADANRQRLVASSELGTTLATANPPAAISPPQPLAPAQSAGLTARDSRAEAGADYTNTKPLPKQPAPTATPPKPLPKREPAGQASVGGPKPAPAPAPASRLAVTAAHGPWRIQLGAFGVLGNAEALWAKLRARPELAGHGKALVPAGKLTKLQAVGFASQASAQAACARLSDAGTTCLVVRD